MLQKENLLNKRFFERTNYGNFSDVFQTLTQTLTHIHTHTQSKVFVESIM